MDRIIGFDTQMLVQMGCQLFNTLVCFGILYWLLYKPVRNFMSERTKRIKTQLDDAQKKNAEAQAIKTEYENKIHEIEEKQKKMLEFAHKQAVANKNMIINEAYREAEKIREQAKLEIEYEKQQLKTDIKQQMINISFTVANEFLADNFNEDVQKKFFDEAELKIEALILNRN